MARLVRCPKCQKLLVEYPNVSVYQCGGCGIALRTKDHIASTEGKSIAEPPRINQPESQSDCGFSDSESISGPLTSTMQCPNLENKAEENSSPATSNLDDHPRTVKRRSSRDVHLADKDQQVDFVEVVGRIENAPVKLTDAEEQPPHMVAHSVGSVEDMEERSQYEGIRDVFKSPATGSFLAYYDGSVSSSDEAPSVRTPERMFGKSRRTIKAASNSDLKLHSDSVRSTSSLPAMTRFSEARDRVSSSKGSSFDSDEFQTAESWPTLPKGSSFDTDEFPTVADLLALSQGSFSGELNDKVALLRKIDEVREQLVKICVPSEGRQGQTSRGTILRSQPPQVHERLQQIPHKLTDPYPQDFMSVANSSSSGSTGKPDEIRRKQMHHCRPVSGAAPFVICAHCTKLLQLPTDLLVPRSRICKLKCAGCNAVLDLPFPAKDQSFSEVDPAPTEPDDEPDSCIVSGGRRDVARGNLTPRLHRLLGYDSASDLLHGDDENDKGYAKMESTRNNGSSSSSFHGNFRPGIPRPPGMK